MVSNRLAFGAVTVACIAAAGGGGYLATRQNTVPTPASAAVSSTPTPAAVPDRPVQETEAVVGDSPKPASQVDASATQPQAPKPAREPRSKADAARTPPPASRSARIVAQDPPPLDRSWPTASAAQPPPPPPPLVDVAPEPPRAPEPPQKSFEELVVRPESVIGLQTETALSSERARVEDRVEAHVTRDVRVNGQIAIPAGAKAIGSVSQVERGGKFKERSRIGIRFHTLVLADGTRLPINTETIIREGAAPEAAQKVGVGAVGGAILGAILGGAKGAAVGAAAGAGGGAAVQMAGDRNAATLPAGSPLTVRIVSPLTITIEKE
jgi:hypothetical protein